MIRPVGARWRRRPVPVSRTACLPPTIDAAELPYFALHSRSNGQAWRLYVQALPRQAPGQAEPDAYGLATASRPFALPCLP